MPWLSFSPSTSGKGRHVLTMKRMGDRLISSSGEGIQDGLTWEDDSRHSRLAPRNLLASCSPSELELCEELWNEEEIGD